MGPDRVDQPAFPYARFPGEKNQGANAALAQVIEGSLNHRDLIFTANGWGIQPFHAAQGIE